MTDIDDPGPGEAGAAGYDMWLCWTDGTIVSDGPHCHDWDLYAVDPETGIPTAPLDLWVGRQDPDVGEDHVRPLLVEYLRERGRELVGLVRGAYVVPYVGAPDTPEHLRVVGPWEWPCWEITTAATGG